ncbi:MAG: ester cyclase [Candidatus Methylumidiphilus alinenensis]|uniref:Ester cyclase n=1 Tax=Candidatus Methylumidiphilus alinenensis TaxID=2202197 RepID=A0A2W4RPN2_9GAMM|nr:MAG: ester cyclase [Candidatus Methylumidiphilus alinenensis]
MSEQNKQIVRRALEEVWQNGNVALIDELYAPDFFNHTLEPGQEQSLELEKRMVARFRAAFPDFEVIIEDLLAAADKVVLRGGWRGTHQGEFMGASPTHKLITVTEIAIFRLDGGKIVELWANTDQLGFLRQLGVVAP